MPSASAQRAGIAFQRAMALRDAALKLHQAQHPTHDIQTHYHAAIAASVATWDAYLKSLVMEFFDVVSDPLNVPYHAVVTIGQRFAQQALNRFNTPNFDNSRTIVVTCTGYDPYNDWSWRRRNMAVIDVHERLNEILKVRHSFAHGSSIPAYAWTQSTSGKVRLTSQAVADAHALLRHLISSTDNGLKQHISTTYRIQANW